MAGMLPGVECARRRRTRPNGSSSDSPIVAAIGSTRKSCFCLYATKHESHFCLQKQRSILVEACEDEKLGGTAREAKRRLDERLRSQRNSHPKRKNNKENLERGGLDSQGFEPKKKRVRWAK
ncbi:uncharacterized protein LOC120124289 [Hibiscus syriacus]|uniref:uncharacterized protein LOC120124289 n=1 Tax=Hibiscus syriacus TaxID=106335 RepID=UPI001923AE0B|nr:uncharacterized protein LOC120124289 [Hibiscus syriacus]